MSERTYERIRDLPVGITPITGAERVELEQDGESRQFSMTALSGIVAEHAEKHQIDGDDPIGTLDNIDGGIPYLDTNGMLDTRVSDATTSVKGKVRLATSGEESATKAVTGTDARLSDARAPTAHASQHIAGTDVIADATVSNSGLMSAADKVKLDTTDQTLIPTEDQKDAMNGATTPSTSNPFLTVADAPDVEDVTDIKNWASFAEHITVEDVFTNPTYSFHDAVYAFGAWYFACESAGVNKWDELGFDTVNFTQIVSANTIRLYYDSDIEKIICVGNGGINTIDSTDAVENISPASAVWTGITKAGGLYYLTAVSSGLYAGATLTTLADTLAGTYGWRDICAHEGVVYAASDGPAGHEGIYTANAGETTFTLYDDSDGYKRIDSANGRLFAFGNNYTLNEIKDDVVSPIFRANITNGVYTDGSDLYSSYSLTFAKLPISNSPTVNIPERYTNTENNYHVPATFPVDGRRVYRKLAAYDGDPVTITPPSGATFEGLASIDLYGQYSYVELERISATVFAIKELRDKVSDSAGIVYREQGFKQTYFAFPRRVLDNTTGQVVYYTPPLPFKTGDYPYAKFSATASIHANSGESKLGFQSPMTFIKLVSATSITVRCQCSSVFVDAYYLSLTAIGEW